MFLVKKDEKKRKIIDGQTDKITLFVYKNIDKSIRISHDDALPTDQRVQTN